MPSFALPMLTYHVHLVHNRSTGTPPSHSRLRTIQGGFGKLPGLTGTYALLFRAEAGWGQTGELTKTGQNAYDLVARVPVAEFADYLTLLQTEQPIRIWINYPSEPAVGQSVAVTNWSLFTGDEPLGEGPNDTSA